jgi:hypothetical protein
MLGLAIQPRSLTPHRANAGREVFHVWNAFDVPKVISMGNDRPEYRSMEWMVALVTHRRAASTLMLR